MKIIPNRTNYVLCLHWTVDNVRLPCLVLVVVLVTESKSAFLYLTPNPDFSQETYPKPLYLCRYKKQ